jgi:CRP-like cAMP-binding protein
MEIWQLHLVMAFSCLFVFTISALAIRKYFLGRRHLKSEFQGPRRKGDGPIQRSEKQIAADSAAVDAVAVAEKFASSGAELEVGTSDDAVLVELDAHRPSSIEHDHVTAVRRFPAVSSASDQEIARLAQHVRVVSLAAGETIFSAGTPAGTAYVIKSGSVCLLPSAGDDTGGNGSRQLVSGDFFGEEALDTTEVYGITAVATAACQLWILERTKVALALSSAHELSKRSIFNNPTLKSAAAAALVASSLAQKHMAARAQPVELLGVSHAAPTPVPQQQAPSSLMSSYAAPTSHTSPLYSSAAGTLVSMQALPLKQGQEAAVPSASGAAASRVPKSLLKKHATLFDSDSNVL